MQFILQTPRFLLREFSADIDAEAMYLLNANPAVIQYTGDGPFESVQDAHSFLSSYNPYASTKMGRWAVIDRVTNKTLGWCGLKQHDDFVDLGYRFYESEWGRGIATESGWASLEYGFKKLGLREIVGRTSPDNKGSIRVLQKLGMTLHGETPCDGIEDALEYRISSENYLPHPFPVEFL